VLSRIQIPELRYSADGCVPFVVPEETGCCPPPLCGNSLCGTFCAFLNLLPSGPMWDLHKAAAISYFQDNDDPAQCPLLKDPSCPSLVLHAVYSVMKLKLMTYTALWPAFRESNPYTAVATLDAWLERLKWEDCWESQCRTVVGEELSPLQVWSPCGPITCVVEFPEELTCAVKRGVAIALTRAQMGVIKSTCGINWIIEPLGAVLKPIYPPPSVDNSPPDPCASMCAKDVSFQVCPTGDFLEGCDDGDPCTTQEGAPPVQAYWDQDCDRPAGLPERVWPGLMAAVCIVRSMMPPSCVSNVKMCC
jgi:hypothetical protein